MGVTVGAQDPRGPWVLQGSSGGGFSNEQVRGAGHPPRLIESFLDLASGA